MNVEPTTAQLEEIQRGYNESEWFDVMLTIDVHDVDLSDNVVLERLLMAKRAEMAETKRRNAQARLERRAELMAVAAELQVSRKSKHYVVMAEVLNGLKSRGVTLTLKARTVTVAAVTRVKGELGETETVIGTFTLKGKDVRWTVGGMVSVLTIAELVEQLEATLPERPSDVMPRKYRDVMRLRHAGRGVTDTTGERAVASVARETGDVLSSADMETYGEYLTQVEGPKLTTAGTVSKQGTRGLSAMTDDERRASDKARQAAYRARKRAERAAMAQA